MARRYLLVCATLNTPSRSKSATAGSNSGHRAENQPVPPGPLWAKGRRTAIRRCNGPAGGPKSQPRHAPGAHGGGTAQDRGKDRRAPRKYELKVREGGARAGHGKYLMPKLQRIGLVRSNNYLLDCVTSHTPQAPDLRSVQMNRSQRLSLPEWRPGKAPMYPKKPKQRADDEGCAACRGTGVIVIANPADPEIKQPPVCPRCGGTGRAPHGQRQAIRDP
jgi:hypothetical protein